MIVYCRLYMSFTSIININDSIIISKMIVFCNNDIYIYNDSILSTVDSTMSVCKWYTTLFFPETIYISERAQWSHVRASDPNFWTSFQHGVSPWKRGAKVRRRFTVVVPNSKILGPWSATYVCICIYIYIIYTWY